MKVLVIPEDQVHDQFILKPIIEALFADLGQPAEVTVLPEPRLRGAGDALDPSLVASILERRTMFPLVLLVVDRDCNRQGNLDKARARQQEHEGRLIACIAVEEVEVWLLALHAERLPVAFAEVRSHCDPKERFAEPLLESLRAVGPGGGRKQAMRALAGRWRGLLARCPELVELKEHVSSWMARR